MSEKYNKDDRESCLMEKLKLAIIMFKFWCILEDSMNKMFDEDSELYNEKYMEIFDDLYVKLGFRFTKENMGLLICGIMGKVVNDNDKDKVIMANTYINTLLSEENKKELYVLKNELEQLPDNIPPVIQKFDIRNEEDIQRMMSTIMDQFSKIQKTNNRISEMEERMRQDMENGEYTDGEYSDDNDDYDEKFGPKNSEVYKNYNKKNKEKDEKIIPPHVPRMYYPEYLTKELEDMYARSVKEWDNNPSEE